LPRQGTPCPKIRAKSAWEVQFVKATDSCGRPLQVQERSRPSEEYRPPAALVADDIRRASSRKHNWTMIMGHWRIALASPSDYRRINRFQALSECPPFAR
jgi:hypothetical protein